MEQPDWLKAAKARWEQTGYQWREPEPVDVIQGDIVVAGDMDFSAPSRMLAALGSDPDRRCFLGALVTDEISLAAADDLILEPHETDLPYRVAILTGLVKFLWFVQIDKRVGAMTEEALQAALALYAGSEHEFQHNRRGMPLQYEEWDKRWADLEAEAHLLRKLSKDCTERRENDDIDLPYIDPNLLDDLTKVELFMEKYDELVTKSQGFAPSCIEQQLGSLNSTVLRAYSAILSPKNSSNGSISKRVQAETREEWLLRCTKEDGLASAPFVKIIGNGAQGYERLRNGGKRVEYLYETVGG